MNENSHATHGLLTAWCQQSSGWRALRLTMNPNYLFDSCQRLPYKDLQVK
jgi:hypothetical protein